MQIPVTTLTLQTVTRTGIVGREVETFSDGAPVPGSLSPMSREDYVKRYGPDSYVDNGTYVLQTQAALAVGQYLTYSDTRYRVTGYRQGRQRNTAVLQEVC